MGQCECGKCGKDEKKVKDSPIGKIEVCVACGDKSVLERDKSFNTLFDDCGNCKGETRIDEVTDNYVTTTCTCCGTLKVHVIEENKIAYSYGPVMCKECGGEPSKEVVISNTGKTLLELCRSCDTLHMVMGNKTFKVNDDLMAAFAEHLKDEPKKFAQAEVMFKKHLRSLGKEGLANYSKSIKVFVDQNIKDNRAEIEAPKKKASVKRN